MGSWEQAFEVSLQSDRRIQSSSICKKPKAAGTAVGAKLIFHFPINFGPVYHVKHSTQRDVIMVMASYLVRVTSGKVLVIQGPTKLVETLSIAQNAKIGGAREPVSSSSRSLPAEQSAHFRSLVKLVQKLPIVSLSQNARPLCCIRCPPCRIRFRKNRIGYGPSGSFKNVTEARSTSAVFWFCSSQYWVPSNVFTLDIGFL